MYNQKWNIILEPSVGLSVYLMVVKIIKKIKWIYKETGFKKIRNEKSQVN